MKTVICFVVLLSLSACDSGTWVDGVSIQCKNGSPVIPKMMPDFNKAVAQTICAQSGKSFTGEFQCKGDDARVKCK